MKTTTLFIITLFLAINAKGQCDNPYYQLKEGTNIVMESFDQKDRFQSRSEMNVVSYDETSSGFVATIGFKMSDKKDKTINEGTYKMECENGLMKIDMTGFVPAESMAAFKDMEVEVAMDQLNYPPNMTVGQKLDDASLKISMANSPMPMNMVMDINNRLVEGTETVKTPAGSFECFKISYNTHMKVMISNMNFKTVEYLSKDQGVVKTETYKSNGNLSGYTLLTKYEY